jgi:hypothetical protein
MTVFVVHPDGTVEPPESDDTVSWEDFHAADTQLAWSAVQPEECAEQRHHGWGRAIRVAVGIVSVAAVIIAGMAVLWNPPHHWEPGPVVVAPETPVAAKTADPAPPGPFVTPTVTAAVETPDGVFLTMLRQGDLIVTDQAAAVSTGHELCGYLHRPMSRGTLAYGLTEQMIRQGRTWTAHDSTVEVDAAAAAYCPEVPYE